jgi:hypothetical protein
MAPVRAQRFCRRGKLDVLDGAGHLSGIELPDTVNKMVRDLFG